MKPSETHQAIPERRIPIMQVALFIAMVAASALVADAVSGN